MEKTIVEIKYLAVPTDLVPPCSDSFYNHQVNSTLSHEISLASFQMSRFRTSGFFPSRNPDP